MGCEVAAGRFRSLHVGRDRVWLDRANVLRALCVVKKLLNVVEPRIDYARKQYLSAHDAVAVSARAPGFASDAVCQSAVALRSLKASAGACLARHGTTRLRPLGQRSSGG